MTLSDATRKLIIGTAHRVWDEIGYDCLQGVADYQSIGHKKVDVNTVTMSRASVIEVVLDADRLSERLREELRRKPNPELAEFLARWSTYTDTPSRDEMDTLMKEAFPHRRYGM